MLQQTSAVLPAAMRVAMVAPPWFELPPVGYGGIESIVADLVDQLAERGHEVTLIGAGRHLTRAAHFVAVFERPPTERLGTPVPEVLHAAAVAEALRDLEVDLVHDHTLAGPLLAEGRDVPTVVTMHGPVTGDLGDYYRRLGGAVNLVAISDAQRRLNPSLNWVGRVHNAIDVATFPYQASKGDYVLWLGRFCKDKAAHLAIEAARAAGLRIVLAGKCNEGEEQAYFARHVERELGPGVEYVGEADAVLKRELLAHARALVFPIQWEEPFGMVMIEAMACGTPVVALARGSVPEVVVHQETGLVVDHVADLPGALRSVSDIDPAACRRHVEERFDLTVMAAGYERVYQCLLSHAASRRPLPALPTDDGRQVVPTPRRAEGMSIA
jgi:glycosyltransferase involved in cell wall biosynthesis